MLWWDWVLTGFWMIWWGAPYAFNLDKQTKILATIIYPLFIFINMWARTS